jgi:hypothetical protein
LVSQKQAKIKKERKRDTLLYTVQCTVYQLESTPWTIFSDGSATTFNNI